jgi:hypothetical protein
MALMSWATQVLQWQVQWAAKEQSGANPKSLSKFGLEAEIRLYEAGIASNRESERHGEYVLGPCTHRPSHHGSWFHPKSLT